MLARQMLATVVVTAAAAGAAAQAPGPPMPRDYRGVSTHIDGIFVTPVPNAPFIASVDILSHNKLPDGTDRIVTTKNHIARASSGRIYNERRRLVSTAYRGEPDLLSAHVFDPSSRLNIFWDPYTRLAREAFLPAPPTASGAQQPPTTRPGVTEEQLGTQSFEGLTLTGVRKSRTVNAERSGTGQPVVITDEYWYSPELSIYLIIKHNDPRTGEQIVAVSKVQRAEPDAQWFTVPEDYKVVDETPPQPKLPIP